MTYNEFSLYVNGGHTDSYFELNAMALNWYKALKTQCPS